jgi:hypothetical protein
MKREHLQSQNVLINWYKQDAGNRKIIESIVPVSEWNKDCHKDHIINVKYGYVIPLFHGYEWKKTKFELIQKYCY